MLDFMHPCRILRIASCVEKPFIYFYRDVWFELGLEESRKFPLFQNGPYGLFGFLIFWLAFLHLFLEPIMKLRTKKFNLRPFLLVFNSCLFTINFVGFLVVSLIVTDFGIDLWTCTFKVNESSKGLMLKMGYVFLLFKLIEILRPALFIIRGHKSHKIDTFNQALFIVLVYLGFLFYPFGIFTWMLFVDTLYHALVYVYLIFSCTGTESMRPVKYKIYLPFINLLKFASMFSHSYITFPSECSGFYCLKVISVIYSAVGFLCATVYMIDKIDMEQAKRKQLKKSD